MQEETVTLYVNGVGASYKLSPNTEGSAGDAGALKELVNFILPDEMVANEDSTTSTAAREQLAAILNAADDAEKAGLQDTMAGRLSYGATDAQYALENQIGVSTSVADSATQYFPASQVEMVGGALNAEKGQPVELQVSNPNPASNYTNHADELSFDLSLLVDGEEQSNLVFPVNVTLPMPAGYDPETVTIYHLVGNTPEPVTIQERDTVNGTVTFTATSFSTYILAQGSVNSSGSGSSEPSYSPSVDVGDGGSVSTNLRTPSAGDDVTITPKPDEGFAVDEVTVTDRNGNPVEVIDNGDGTYSFTQPTGRVTIEVTFREISQPLPFTDVPEGYWAYDEIAWAWENGYMNGTSAATFSPNASISRQQVWMILARLSGSSPADMAEARQWAIDNGISDGTNPGGAVTRQQLAALLFRFAQANGYDSGERAALTGFPDAASVSAYAVEALQWAVAEGIVSGTSDGRLNPGGTATRAQFAVMLDRFLA